MYVQLKKKRNETSSTRGKFWLWCGSQEWDEVFLFAIIWTEFLPPPPVPWLPLFPQLRLPRRGYLQSESDSCVVRKPTHPGSWEPITHIPSNSVFRKFMLGTSSHPSCKYGYHGTRQLPWIRGQSTSIPLGESKNKNKNKTAFFPPQRTSKSTPLLKYLYHMTWYFDLDYRTTCSIKSLPKS